MTRTIGTYHLREPRTFEVAQEYAGAAERIAVPAGDYPVEERTAPGGYRYLCVSMPGTSVYRHFYNRIGACGRMDVDDTPRPATHHLLPRDYELAAMAVAGTVTLATGWSTVPHVYTGSRWDETDRTYVPCDQTMHLLREVA